MYLTSKNRLAEGRFGTMFKQLPAFAPRDDLLDEPGQDDGRGPDGASDDNHRQHQPCVCSRGSPSSGSSSTTTSRSTHTPLDQQQADPDATVNFRTPRYDLDSVYGRGPVKEPQFYDPADPDKLLVTAERQRCPGRAA